VRFLGHRLRSAVPPQRNPGAAQHRFDEVGGGGLAAGAGDADHGQCPRRVIEEFTGHGGDRVPAIGNARDRDAGRGNDGALDHQRLGSARQRHGDELVAIGPHLAALGAVPRQTDEHVAGLHRTRIRCDRPHRHVEIARNTLCRDAPQEIGKVFHVHRTAGKRVPLPPGFVEKCEADLPPWSPGNESPV
jgi:hypothetical protein